MKRIERILLATLMFCSIPVANLFALSPEATQVIESMRAKLQQVENVKEEIIDSAEYVPGQELAAALERLRKTRNTDSINTKALKNEEVVPCQTSVKAENKESRIETLKAKLNAIWAKLPNANLSEDTKAEEIKEEAIEIKEVTEVKEAAKAVEKESSSVYVPAMPEKTDSQVLKEKENARSRIANLIAKSKEAKKVKEESKTTGEKLQKSDLKTKHSQSDKAPAKERIDNSAEVMKKANDEIQELFNNPQKRAEVAEKGRKAKAKKAQKPKEEPKIDDKEFNDYISKYDFKMPENYRIIVE